MTGWLGSGIPIPGLRKNEAAPAEPEPAPVEPAEAAEPKEPKDDDDNSRYNRYEGFGRINECNPEFTGLWLCFLRAFIQFHKLIFLLLNIWFSIFFNKL